MPYEVVLNPHNPTHGVGLVYRGQPPDDQYLGTCFALRRPTHFLTAAHCIADFLEKDLFVMTQHWGGQKEGGVERIVRHPTADIALLVVSKGLVPVKPFFGYGDTAWGKDVVAYGFPIDILGANPGIPTPRIFKGHLQTFMQHKSVNGAHEYAAAELSFPCPAGLSGGPLFIEGVGNDLIGMVTENRESTTYLDTIEEDRRDGALTRKLYQRVISYGVALLFEDVMPWLTANIDKDPSFLKAGR
jgi:hypothetical protein